jgi:hypothetical protein
VTRVNCHSSGNTRRLRAEKQDTISYRGGTIPFYLSFVYVVTRCDLQIIRVCLASKKLTIKLKVSFRFVVLPSSTYLFTAGVEGFCDFT